MKKIAECILSLLLVLFSCSCSWNRGIIMHDDRSIANEEFEKILQAVQIGDSDMLIELFSQKSIQNLKEFDKCVDELFEYFEGEVESYNDWGGPYVETIRENNQIFQLMESSYDVKTSECEYRFAVTYVVEDTNDSSNVGIQSIYVINSEYDTDLQYAYWGDGKNTPGINIGIPNAV